MRLRVRAVTNLDQLVERLHQMLCKFVSVREACANERIGAVVAMASEELRIPGRIQVVDFTKAQSAARPPFACPFLSFPHLMWCPEPSRQQQEPMHSLR